MKLKKIAAWEDHNRVPGGDEVMLLEAIEIPTHQPRYLRLSWSELTPAEFAALDRGEIIERNSPPRALCTRDEIEQTSRAERRQED
jgi:hypothetical protein